MCAGQVLLIAILAVDAEPVDTIHTLKLLETIERNFTRACYEL